MGGGVRGGGTASLEDASPLRLRPYLQAGPRRRSLPVLRHHRRVSRVVRGQRPGMAGLWPRGLNIARPHPIVPRTGRFFPGFGLSATTGRSEPLVEPNERQKRFYERPERLDESWKRFNGRLENRSTD